MRYENGQQRYYRPELLSKDVGKGLNLGLHIVSRGWALGENIEKKRRLDRTNVWGRIEESIKSIPRQKKK